MIHNLRTIILQHQRKNLQTNVRSGSRANWLRALVLAGMYAIFCLPPATAQQSMEFGIDAVSAKTALGKGMPITYASLWAGSWNQKYGWAGIESQLQAAKASGLVPLVQWWYWGDDISPDCVENGCWDGRQGVQKDKTAWFRLSNELADLMVHVAGAGSPGIVVLETEFNRNGIENHEPFDEYLSYAARIFSGRRIKVVVGFGNWGQPLWRNFDRAVASADLVGTMALQSSIHEASTYPTGADMLIGAARNLQSTFGKPGFVTDFAFSSYPGPSWESNQDKVVRDIFARMGELKTAGVQGMVWRMLSDDPAFDTSNYHGEAERHWGLLRADGSEKMAFSSFLNGMVREKDLQTGGGRTAAVEVWWPTDGAKVSGIQPFQAVVSEHSLESYQVYWQVDGGTLNSMTDVLGVSQHKEASVDVSSWNWRGQGPYSIRFVAKDAGGIALADKTVSIYVQTEAKAAAELKIWWPTEGAKVTGIQPFQAVVLDNPLASYQMYWQVDGGALNSMADLLAGSPHKEAHVDVSSWNWRGQGPYSIRFVAKDAGGITLADKTVSIYVQTEAKAAAELKIWWPTEGAKLTGIQPFQAVVLGYPVASYQMYWQVDGGVLNSMADLLAGSPHKEAHVDVWSWNWRGEGPYSIRFVAKDVGGLTLADKTVSIYVQAAARAAAEVKVWWPTEGVKLTGIQPFQAVVLDYPLASYQMYWQVDGGTLNSMLDVLSSSPHKEAPVDVSSWNWRGQGAYSIRFVAKDAAGAALAEKTVIIYVPAG